MLSGNLDGHSCVQHISSYCVHHNDHEARHHNVLLRAFPKQDSLGYLSSCHSHEPGCETLCFETFWEMDRFFFTPCVPGYHWISILKVVTELYGGDLPTTASTSLAAMGGTNLFICSAQSQVRYCIFIYVNLVSVDARCHVLDVARGTIYSYM